MITKHDKDLAAVVPPAFVDNGHESAAKKLPQAAIRDGIKSRAQKSRSAQQSKRPA